MQFLLFSPKKRRKTNSFTQKWLDHLLLMTSYLFTIATDSHQTCVKMCLRGMSTATENGRCWQKSSRKKLRRTLWGRWGGGWHPRPFVRPGVNIGQNHESKTHIAESETTTVWWIAVNIGQIYESKTRSSEESHLTGANTCNMWLRIEDINMVYWNLGVEEEKGRHAYCMSKGYVSYRNKGLA